MASPVRHENRRLGVAACRAGAKRVRPRRNREGIMKQWKRLGMAAALSAACGAAGMALPAAAQMKYDGVTVNIVTFTGPQRAEPLQRRAPDFQKLTGAKINVITVPFSDLYAKLLTDWSSGTNSIDATVFAPQWMVDYATPGYLEDLTARID